MSQNVVQNNALCVVRFVLGGTRVPRVLFYTKKSVFNARFYLYHKKNCAHLFFSTRPVGPQQPSTQTFYTDRIYCLPDSVGLTCLSVKPCPGELVPQNQGTVSLREVIPGYGSSKRSRTWIQVLLEKLYLRKVYEYFVAHRYIFWQL